jgi:hypothetical protein
MLQRFGEWGATVTVTLNDGSQRNVTSYEELLAVFGSLEQERRYASTAQYQGLPDTQIEKEIAAVEQRIKRRKRFERALTQAEQGIFHYVIINPLKQQLRLLRQEQETRRRVDATFQQPDG